MTIHRMKNKAVLKIVPTKINSHNTYCYDWMKCILGIHVCGGTQNDALLFSQVSPKHDDDGFDTLWNSIVRKDYEKQHYLLDDIVLRCSVDLMYSLRINETINAPFVNDLTDYVMKYHTVAVRATYGLGKTYRG